MSRASSSSGSAPVQRIRSSFFLMNVSTGSEPSQPAMKTLSRGRPLLMYAGRAPRQPSSAVAMITRMPGWACSRFSVAGSASAASSAFVS